MVFLTKKVIKIPLTVVTLTNVPNSLRGDLTKWMQEIATGVYVGNFNTKVREKLWQRILENIGDGQATISYSYRNEIGYKFDTANTERESLDYEGIPLVLVRKDESKEINKNYKKGFSKAAKFRKAHLYSDNKKEESSINKGQRSYEFVVIDIETDGLDFKKNNIIEIGAVKICGESLYYFQSLVKINKSLPSQVSELTKINDKLLEDEGRDIEKVLEEFLDFIGDYPLVGYNLNFDIMFINSALKQARKNQIKNKKYDLLNYVKKEKKFLPSYKLSYVLKEYDIKEDQPHIALEDAKLTFKLSNKVDKFLKDLDNK